jgi:hypothetical protein
MKNHFLTLFLCVVFISSAQAQAWTAVGLKLGGGTSWLIDKNIFDDNTYVHDFSGAFNVGAKASLNLGANHSLSFEVMLAKMKQNFNYEFTNDAMLRIESTNEIRWTNVDLYFLYRYYSQGAFSEFGIMSSRVQSVEQRDPFAGFTDYTDVTSNYQNYLSGVFGGGAFVAGSDRFTLMLGIRIHYAFTDFISDAGNDRDALAAQGQAFPYPNTFRQDFSNLESDPYADARKTSPLLVEMIAEFNFGIGYFAKTICSGRVKWFGG